MARHVLSVAFICVSLASFADTIPEDAINTYFAPQTILDGYPGCDGLGQIALRTDFVADKVDFSVAGFSANPRWRSQSSEDLCDLIERRGTATIRINVPCGNDGAVPVAPCPRNGGPPHPSVSIRYAVAGRRGNPVDYWGSPLFKLYDQPLARRQE